MKLSLSPPPYADAPVVVLISGLGGSGSYWLPQLAVLEQEYQVVCYDQRGTGNNPDTLAEDYSIAQMAAELHQALVAAGIEHYAVVGHALGALVGMQLALDYPASVTVSIFITDWKNYAAINEIYAEFFPGDKPARFCIQCGLVKPDALVEIATIAHIAK